MIKRYNGKHENYIMNMYILSTFVETNKHLTMVNNGLKLTLVWL